MAEQRAEVQEKGIPLQMKNVEFKMKNVARAASLSMLAFAAYNNLAATPQTPQASKTFNVVALVDSLDFAKQYDVETTTGTVQILEHVLLTHANDI